MMIALTGERGVGKTASMKYLKNAHHFVSSHEFNIGKHMTLQMLRYIGVPDDEAHAMVHGDKRDTPSPYLPNNATCRHFMEEFGYFCGFTLGPQWTLGLEIARIKRWFPDANIVMDSLVYGPQLFHELGGYIVRIERSNRDTTIVAPRTSAAQDTVEPDITLKNEGTLEELHENLDWIVSSIRDRSLSPA